MLGEILAKQVLKSVNYDLDNTVFSFIPNTAETSFYGLIQGAERELNKQKQKQILKLGKNPKEGSINKILNKHVRVEKLVVKDAKLRTFITNGK
jgi:amidophosphoribosyltransferase